MKRIILLISSFIVGINCYSQQVPIYSQYIENTYLVNPAVAGNEGLTILNVSSRIQWLGMDDSPRTSSISAQGRLLKKKYFLKNLFFSKTNKSKDKYIPKKEGKVGWGCYLFNDKSALIGRTDFQVSYAYHTFFKGSKELSFGLGLSGSQIKLESERIINEDPYDPLLYSDASETKFIPNANVGAYFLTRNYFAGFSALQLFKTKFNLRENVFSNYTLYRQYFLIAGYNFYLTPDYLLVPSLLVRSSDYIEYIQSDISLRLNYKEIMWTGLTFRTNKDFVALVGFRLKNVFITYSYDYLANPIRQCSFGTHEISVALKLGDITRRYKWLDRY